MLIGGRMGERDARGMARRRGGRRGLTLIEVVISILIVATLLLASTAALSTSLMGVDQAKRVSDAAVFMETVMEDLSAQPYDNLLALNGDQVFSGTDAADSQHVIDLSVFPAEVDLLQIRAAITDLRTHREVGSVTSFRSRR